METLTIDKIRSWLEQRSVKITSDDYLYFDVPEHCYLAIELPKKPYQLVSLANALIPHDYDGSAPFQGALLWIRQWGVWSELVERVGMRVMEVMRRSHGHSKSLEDAPGILFTGVDLIELQVCFVQPLLIGWDAFLVPESGDYFVATSHDETIHVVGRTQQIHENLRARLYPWNPMDRSERE
jgi:hypothetical protein